MYYSKTDRLIGILAIVFYQSPPMTTQSVLIKLAQQGDAIAIAALMNAVLRYQHIRVSAQLEAGCLRIMLKSTLPLNQHAAIAFIRRGLLGLQVESVHSVRVYAWRIGQDFPAWVSEFAVVETLPASIPEVSSEQLVIPLPSHPVKVSTSKQFPRLEQLGFVVVLLIVVYMMAIVV